MKKVLKFPQYNRKVVIKQDRGINNPRKENDYLGKCIFFGVHSNLGDKHEISTNDFPSFDEMKKNLEKKASVVIPVYGYSHSGLTIATTPFSCRWDSGQLGFIVAYREDILKEYDCKIVTKKLKEKVASLLESEVTELKYYVEGEVYWYKTKDLDTNEELDSCGGFFGDIPDNGIHDYLDFDVTKEEYETAFAEATWKY